ncbi:hypothetical protein F5984_01745 [Rudanella paleaurantiibacter]|uniref:Lipoprotein n=1 Tax=Rudanella paleaurantiibacter TaxID=2614655 RepID=A0A7J5U4D5_9BACT|nr:hypothetical protein [Rudanella paleaurantiibacter]KAB7732699.1 hypothetical protein F5984_01745 [Rudanella paleaurantiibacter]
MKRSFLFFALFLGLLTSCKQLSGKEAEVDPRDQYIGVYDDGGYTGQVFIGSIVSERPSGTVTITVGKAAAPKELTMSFLYNKGKQFEYTEKLTAELDGTKFTIIDKKSEQITVGVTTIDAPYQGKGEFADGTKFAMTTSSEKDQSGTIVKKVLGITGFKK